MPNTVRKPPPSMTVADFLAWPGDGTGRKFQLVDGEVRAMSPGSTAHGRIQSTLARLIGNALLARASPCDVHNGAGGRHPRACRHQCARAGRGRYVHARYPWRAAPAGPGFADRDPLPTNTADTWENVWSYCTIPSVREIAIVHSTRALAELLRRGPDGHWPEETEKIGPGGTLVLQSIQFSCPLTDVYARTDLGRGG